MRYRSYVASGSLGDFYIKLTFLSKCDIAIRSHQGRNVMLLGDSIATLMRCRLEVASGSLGDIQFGDIAAT